MESIALESFLDHSPPQGQAGDAKHPGGAYAGSARSLQMESDLGEFFDGDVLQTPDIDHFCSSSAWIIPAHQALMGPREPWLHRSNHGWALFAKQRLNDGSRIVQPLEAAWGLACPLIAPGHRAPGLVDDFTAHLWHKKSQWDFLMLCGVVQGSPLFQSVLGNLAHHYEIRLGARTRRHIASLEGGIDGFLARRSRGFRKALRKSETKAKAADIHFEIGAGPGHLRPENADKLFERILAIESRSWKGLSKVGISDDDFASFYRLMLARLLPRERARIIFATQDGADIAYVFGAVFGNTYRGLQFSYDQDFRSYGLGSLCQWQQIQSLCREGYRHYDLGTEMAYKERWGERVLDTETLFVVQR